MSTKQSIRLMLSCQGSNICIAQDSCMERLKNKHGTDATTHPLATLESFNQNSQKLDGSKWLSKTESWKRDQLRGEPEEKAICLANIKVSVSILKVFVFSFFSWKSLPATFGEAPCHYGSTLTGFQRCGHARIASIPGFFHKLPWLSTASWNGHIFADWPATINLLCRGSDGILNLYSQHPIPALTDDMNKLLFSHRALTVTRPWVWILQAWLPPLNGYVSHVRGVLEPNLSHAKRHLRRWEAQHDLQRRG